MCCVLTVLIILYNIYKRVNTNDTNKFLLIIAKFYIVTRWEPIYSILLLSVWKGRSCKLT